MSIAVQIYEIQNPREAEAVIDLGVDRIGSVILSVEEWKVPAIKEAIRVSKAAGIKHSLLPLFNTKGSLFRAIDYYQPAIIHFCQSLTQDNGYMIPFEALIGLQVRVKEQFPSIELMRSVPVPAFHNGRGIPTLDIAKSFEAVSDYFLIDTCLGKEPVKGYLGITGRPCDWEVARRLVESSTIPAVLAGGLSPENVYEAIMAVRPFGADSCTKTNAQASDGRFVRFQKDYEKVRAFVAEVRRAEKDLPNLGNP
jgi:phosphoribosylanthranilate isomerase